MKLGFVSAILGDLSLEQVLAFAAAERFDCVEMMCWPVGKADRRYAGVTHINVDELATLPAAAERVKEQIARSGVAVSGLGYYPNLLAAASEEARTAASHLEKVIRAAAML